MTSSSALRWPDHDAHTNQRPDPQQFRALAERHVPALRAFATRLINGDTHAAEDVVQEALIRARQQPEAFAPGRGSARGWLFTVTRNVAIDVHRRRTRQPEVGDAQL